MIDTPDVISFSPLADFLSHLAFIVAAALVSGTLCALIVLFIPRRISLARDTLSIVTANAVLVGCFSVFGIGAISVLYGISLIFIVTFLLLPVAAVIWLGTAVLLISGWVVVAEPVGQWLLRRRAIYAAPMAAAAVGGFVLTFGTLIISWLPVFGWMGTLLGVIIAAAGMGGLLLTRLGTRAYPEMVIAGD